MFDCVSDGSPSVFETEFQAVRIFTHAEVTLTLLRILYMYQENFFLVDVGYSISVAQNILNILIEEDGNDFIVFHIVLFIEDSRFKYY